MPKYSYRPKNSKEPVNTITASNLQQAIDYFAKIKVLSKDKFLEIYEVIER